MNVYQQLRLSIAFLILLALVPVGAALAQVEVTSADPASAPQGTISLDVTIAGNGFDSTANVKFLVTGTTDPGGITVKSVKVRGSRKLIATIDIAETAVVDKFDIVVELSDGRKGKGTSLFAVQPKTNNGDPCAAPNLDFPAFTYWQQSGKGQQIYVADATGQCSRPVVKPAAGAGGHVFSYPVAGTLNVGRVVWPEGPAVHGIDFTVTGSTIVLGQSRLIYGGPLNVSAIDLSNDGTTLFFGACCVSAEEAPTIYMMSVDDALPPVLVYASSAGTLGTFFDVIAVSEDNANLFADLRVNGAGRQLIRIQLPCTDSSCADILFTNAVDAPTYPAAGQVDGKPTLVYSDWLLGYDRCWQLRYLDLSSSPPVARYEGGQPRYGAKSTWYAGQVLTNGRNPPDGRGRCGDTGMVTRIDPSTGAQSALVRGYDPDAR